MKLAVALHHDPVVGTRSAAVVFDDWGAAEPTRTCLALLPADAPVEALPGATPREARELAALLRLLHEHALVPELIVFDGSVHLDAAGTPGPGLRLHAALGGRCAVVGASKAARPAMPAQFELHREDEARPLTVTCVGIDLGAAKVRLRGMHGKRRVPTLLKLAARIAKGGAD
jgi:deoxyribonuclease V